MGELIAAGARAGLRFWWPAMRVAYLPLAALAFLLVALRILGSLSAVTTALLVALVVITAANAIARLYMRALTPDPFSELRSTLRLIASWSLVALFMAVLTSLFFVVLLCTLYAVASAGLNFNPKDVASWPSAIERRGRWVASTVFVVGALMLLWAGMRVWLTSATTVAERRIAMLSTWPYTRGLVLPAVLARFILSLPALILVLVLRLASGLTHVFWEIWTPGVVVFGWLPLQVGAEAEFYRRRVLPPKSAP